jgi:hypothetical protein
MTAARVLRTAPQLCPFLKGGASFASSSDKSFSSVWRFPSSVVPGDIPIGQCCGRTMLIAGYRH